MNYPSPFLLRFESDIGPKVFGNLVDLVQQADIGFMRSPFCYYRILYAFKPMFSGCIGLSDRLAPFETIGGAPLRRLVGALPPGDSEMVNNLSLELIPQMSVESFSFLDHFLPGLMTPWNGAVDA